MVNMFMSSGSTCGTPMAVAAAMAMSLTTSIIAIIMFGSMQVSTKYTITILNMTCIKCYACILIRRK